MAVKRCELCGKDCADAPRVKDSRDRYYHRACYEKAVERRRRALAESASNGETTALAGTGPIVIRAQEPCVPPAGAESEPTMVACCTSATCGQKFKLRGRAPADPSKLRCSKCEGPLEIRPLAAVRAVPAPPPAPPIVPAPAAGDAEKEGPCEAYSLSKHERLAALLKLDAGGGRPKPDQTRERVQLIAQLLAENPWNCPGCRGAIEPGAALCVNCGLRFSTGTRLRTVVEGIAPSGGGEGYGIQAQGAGGRDILAAEADALMAKARQKLDQEEKERARAEAEARRGGAGEQFAANLAIELLKGLLGG